MSNLFADLDGTPLTRAIVQFPYSGIWHADVTLSTDTPALTSGPHVLTIADLTLACTAVRSVTFTGAIGVRLVGGAGGWRNALPAKQYQSALGILLSTVLLDAALAAGELPPVLSTDRQLSKNYLRPQDKASKVLETFLFDGWWVDNAGIVQTKSRDASAITSQFSAMSVDMVPGRYTIAADIIGDWMPGRTFNGPTVAGTISRTMHTLDGTALRTEVMVN